MKELLVPLIITGLICWGAVTFVKPPMLGTAIAVIVGVIFIIHYLLPLL